MWAYLVMKQRILLQDLPLIFFQEHFLTAIFKSLVSHLLSAWQQKWDLFTTNKLYSVKPIGLWPALPMREFDVKLTRLRIGHTRFTHRHLFLGQRAPRCPTCQVDFTVNHILIECPSFKCHREYHFNSSFVTLQDLLTKDKISTHQSTLKPFPTTTPTSVDIELLPMAVLPPLEKRILQSRESDADAEMSSSSASEEDALEYNMSEDLEDSPAVISPPPPSKPEKTNKYKSR
ncbi:hypothetical protein AVEN_19539-1 [Araneus ventricosus]|uniref:Reverse transcriptase zinc-binding domain-containing protein n=1 Tax=Araneus ventricosus TaxID=182803 RepID=A0A4Y2RQ11_ARAVE|nr:hypothetical protein AVEN_19539-1 [Araneus ventricosus]